MWRNVLSDDSGFSRLPMVFLVMGILYAHIGCSSGGPRSIDSEMRNPAYSRLFREIKTSHPLASKYYLVLYVDIRSNLSCYTDMDLWRQWEKDADRNGGCVVLLAPRADSVDVAIAMELEQMKTSVQVLDEDLLSALNWNNHLSPLLVKYDDKGNIERLVILDLLVS